MGDLGIIELTIIGFVIFAKFALIIGVALWSKANGEKKKKMFLAQEERRKILQNRNPEI